MKRLSDKLQNIKNFATKTIGKYALIGALATTSVGVAKGQTADVSYKKQWPIMDVYSQPNITQGNTKGKLEYYGSGDVNNDGKIDSTDVQQIYSGVKNGMADVDGNDTIDSRDGKLIEDYIDGKIGYLPGHWDELNKLKGVDPKTGENLRYLAKVKWLEKMIKISIDDWGSMPIENGLGADCEMYCKRYLFNWEGISNFKQYSGVDDNGNGTLEGYDYYKSFINLGDGNIPAFIVQVTRKDGQEHTWPGVFVGEKKAGKEDNILDLSETYVFDYGNQGGGEFCLETRELMKISQ